MNASPYGEPRGTVNKTSHEKHGGNQKTGKYPRGPVYISKSKCFQCFVQAQEQIIFKHY